MQLRKDKRGLEISLNFVIGFIIGILCVIPLLYLGSTLMDILFSSPKEILQAQGTLDLLQNTIEPLYIDESTSQPLLIYAPAGWWFLGFDKESKTYVKWIKKSEVKSSKECAEKICLCICKNSANCEKNSACKEFSKPFLIDNKNMAVQINIIGLNITNREKSYEVEIVK